MLKPWRVLWGELGPFKEILKALAGEEGAGPAAANGHEGGAGLCPPASYSAEGGEGQLLGVIRELKLGSWALFLSIFAEMKWGSPGLRP